MTDGARSVRLHVGRRLRVLVVDDDEDQYVLMRGWLREAYGDEYELAWAPETESARRMLDSETFDVCFVDYRLGADTGIDLIRGLHGDGCRVPLIMLTGTAERDVDMEALAVGAADYLVKEGLTSRAIERSVRYTLDRALAGEQLRLQAEVGRILCEAACSEEARPKLLRAIAERLNARIVVKWNLAPGTAGPRVAASWTAPGDQSGELFAAASATITAMPGGGPVSRVFASDAPLWLEDLSQAAGFTRKSAALAANLHTGLLVPIPSTQAANRGVLEMYWDYPMVRSERLIETVAGIGRQIGHFLERVDAQRALYARDQELRALFEAASDAILIADDTGSYVEANPSACALLGGSREALIGRRVGSFSNSSAAADIWRAFLEDGRLTGEVTVVRPDGQLRWLDYRGTRNFIPGRHLLMLRDMTDQRSLEQQLLQSQKMETLGRLAGGVAHDFNNLLTIILGNVEYMRAGADDEYRDVLGDIHDAGLRAAELTGQLLAFSRKQLMQVANFDLNETVKGMERMLARLLGEDVRLRTAFATPAAAVRADRGQIEQVIINLAVNARDAMPRGGELTIETGVVEVDADCVVQFSDLQPGRYVQVSISDTGIGMDPETITRVFEPFFTTKEQGRGTGLGLATVYGTIRQTGGHIAVYSEVGHGTTFKVYLPAVDAADAAEAVRAPVLRNGSETILVVEDSDGVRRLTAEVLRRSGYTVLQAADGLEAVDVARAHNGRIDLLLTDVVMPGPSGRELYERLVNTRPELKVIYCSGYTDEAIVHHRVLRHGVAFVQKPFTSAGILTKVREVLDAISTS